MCTPPAAGRHALAWPGHRRGRGLTAGGRGLIAGGRGLAARPDPAQRPGR